MTSIRILIDGVRSRFRVPPKNGNFPFASAVRVGFIFLVVSGFGTAGSARERGPRVEVECPAPPVPVRIDKQQLLVYELHITNFDMVPVTLKRVEIFANKESSEPLSTLADDSLSASMIRVGATMAMGDSAAGAKDARTIERGGRNVVFVWIELQPNRTVPGSLKPRAHFGACWLCRTEHGV
jgi:hypothetical protein